MYEAKKQGHNNYQFFRNDMNARTTEHKWIEAELRTDALERQEFVLHYQPKINLQTGEITGAEALIRWQHPVRGLLLPAQSIPVAERVWPHFAYRTMGIKGGVQTKASLLGRCRFSRDSNSRERGSSLEFRSEGFLNGLEKPF